MKTIHFLIPLSVCGAVLLATGCDSMNDIQETFAAREEVVYLGKVDSLRFFPGFGRAKITWYIGADPKIQQTVIYWNMRQDSLVKPVNRTKAGPLKDSIIVENLPEGSSLFEFRNTNDRGESSLFSSLTVSSWGGQFAEGLTRRKIVSKELDYDNASVRVELSPTVKDDNVVYSEIKYVDKKGSEQVLRLQREDTLAVLPDVPDGGFFEIRTVFFLPTGIDTVYSDYAATPIPKAIKAVSTQLSIGHGPSSSYFDWGGVLCEWTRTGDLIRYAPDGKGGFTQERTLPAIASRTDFKAFFFYDDDKFITVGTNDKLSFWKLDITKDDPVLEAVKRDFAQHFTMPEFLPSKGLFFSLSADGVLKTWFANNDGTWSGGKANGTDVATDFRYTTCAMWKFSSIVGIDADGYLWNIPVSPNGKPLSREKVGQGWNGFQRLVGIGDELLAMDTAGTFWKFDFNADHYWVME